jgi:hypothetical protein
MKKWVDYNITKAATRVGLSLAFRAKLPKLLGFELSLINYYIHDLPPSVIEMPQSGSV